MLQSNSYRYKDGLVYRNQYCVIFCPKYRRKVLVNGVDIRLKEIMYETAKENDIILNSIDVMPDRVHLSIEVDPRIAVHIAIRELKARSSRILREEFPWLKSKIPSLWTRSYFCCSVGDVSEAAVEKYIEDQKNK